MSPAEFTAAARESDMDARRSMGLAALPVVLSAWAVVLWWVLA